MHQAAAAAVIKTRTDFRLLLAVHQTIKAAADLMTETYLQRQAEQTAAVVVVVVDTQEEKILQD
jgi:membrane-bound ClpP family serine protease